MLKLADTIVYAWFCLSFALWGGWDLYCFRCQRPELTFSRRWFEINRRFAYLPAALIAAVLILHGIFGEAFSR